MKTVEIPNVGVATVLPEKAFKACNPTHITFATTKAGGYMWGLDEDASLIAMEVKRLFDNDIIEKINEDLYIGIGGIEFTGCSYTDNTKRSTGGWISPVHFRNDRPNWLEDLKSDPSYVGYIHLTIEKGRVVKSETVLFDE